MTYPGNLEKDGYTLIKNPYPHTYLQLIADWLDTQLPVLANKNFYSPHFQFGLHDMPEYGVLYDVWQRYPLIRDLASEPAIYTALMPVIGPDVFLYENSFLFKTANTLDYVPWHQDFMNRPDEPIKYIAFISLDPLCHDQGALKVIPGSHHSGFYPFRVKQGHAHHTGIPESSYKDLQIDKAIYVNQEPGDILIFNQLLVHSLDKLNPTCSSRCRSFRFSYQGFEDMYAPRHSPVSIFGGNPDSIQTKHYRPHAKAFRDKTLALRLYNKLISQLAIFTK